MRVDCSAECVLGGLTGLCNCSSVHVKYLQSTFVGTSLLACAAHKVCVCLCAAAVQCNVRDNMINGDEGSRSECSLV